jgi:predicted N-acyltransferase
LGPSSTKITLRAVGSISDVDAAAWDALDHGPSPFLRHGFLRALEDSGSIDFGRSLGRKRSGWLAIYLLAEGAGRLLGAVPAFVKSHSYGEYIFDWGWASAAPSGRGSSTTRSW